MRRFLLYAIAFCSLCTLSILGVFSLADGSTDEYYLKMTSPKQTSLIIGSSRAGQGLQPAILNTYFKDIKLYNYAFSRIHTPYGNAYLESIIRKLKPQITNGVFILEVSPWTVSSMTKNPEDSLNFKENGSFIEKVSCVDCNPNLEYLVYSYESPYRNLIQDYVVNNRAVHVKVEDDGWCKVEYLNPSYNFMKAEKRTINRYQLQLKNYSGISQTRLSYLKKTIQFLQNHGTVYLVRLPVVDAMLIIENELVTDFDLIIENIANAHHVSYLNLIPKRFNNTFIDGHHLDVTSGERISKYIAEYIINDKTF